MKKPPYAPGSTLRKPDKPMARFNPERRARRESEGLVYGEIHEYTKRLPCVLADREDHICDFYPNPHGCESHHVKSVGSGGQDENNTAPMCGAAHDEVHRLGLTRWCEKYGRDLRSIACEVTARFHAAMAEGEGPEE